MPPVTQVVTVKGVTSIIGRIVASFIVIADNTPLFSTTILTGIVAFTVLRSASGTVATHFTTDCGDYATRNLQATCTDYAD
jgi:hypothetical protein